MTCRLRAGSGRPPGPTWSCNGAMQLAGIWIAGDSERIAPNPKDGGSICFLGEGRFICAESISGHVRTLTGRATCRSDNCPMLTGPRPDMNR